MAEVQEKKKEVRTLNSRRHQLTEHANPSHSVTVEMGTTLEDIQNPQFFAHVAPLFTQWDRVCLKPDDGAWYAELVVVECGNNYVRTQALAFMQIDKSEAIVPDAFETHRVEFAGAHHKWRVVRNSDNSVVKFGMEKAEAHLWRDEHVKGLSK